ncbi:MAG: FxLYD domain-containing protein [Candidatus Heimdallarchaeaceae archaeon]
MNKKILIIFLILTLLIVGFSGCTETEVEPQWENVEIIRWYEGTYWEAGRIMNNGLIYNEDAKFYKVNGTAINQASKGLRNVIIWVKYYDINNTILWEDGVLQNSVAQNQTWEFQSLYISSREHFKEVDHVEFDISGEFDD